MTTLLIRVEETADGWPVHLFVDDGDHDWLTVPAATTLLPAALTAAARPLLPGGLGAGIDEIRTFLLEQDQPSDRFETIGTYLHGLLDSGHVGDRWREHARGPVRLLLDVRSERLAVIPWELMCRGPKRLATDITRPFARVGHAYPGAGELRPVRWPLRVLVVVGSKREDQVVDAEPEITRLSDAFRRMCGLVDVEFLRQPSRRCVRETYQRIRPHIFHFIGHGNVESGRGRLEIYDAARRENVAWTAAEITTDLAGWQPRVAILNSCRTTSVEQQDGAWRVADAFAELGVPAVIAMQADIRGDAAAEFTGGLYRALAGGRPLDVAVAEGRRAITDVVDFEHRDFALPSLTVNAPPEDVLRMRFGVGEEHRRRVENTHAGMRAFVDRAEARRRLWPGLDPEPDDPPNEVEPPDAIAIVGGSAVGKSELARWCVGAFELHGGNAAYVDFASGGRLAFFDALEKIGERLSESTVHGTRNRPAFEEWSRRARMLIGTDHPPDDAVPVLFATFIDALRKAAGEQPVLIVLDHVGGIEEHHWSFVRRWLLDPIAQHLLPPVRVIVVLSDEQRTGWPTGDIERIMPQPVELARFKADEWPVIAGQYLGYHFNVDLDDVAERLRQLPVIGEWSWPDLVQLAGFVPRLGWRKFP